MPSRTYVEQRLGALAALSKATDLAGYRLEPHPPFGLRDRYFDTDDGELLRRGLCLRVREKGDERRALLRPVRPSDDGPVVDVPLESADQLESLEPLRDVLIRVTGAPEPPPLLPLLSLRQYRTPRATFDRDRFVGLLSFDVVVFELPDGPHASNELDVELAEAGTEADLHALDPFLRAAGLEQAARTKVERGIEKIPRRMTEPLLLLPHERDVLDEILTSGDALHQRRARVLLLDARGFRSATIANQLGLSTARVRHWKQLFRDQRLEVFEGAAVVASASPAYTVSEIVAGAPDGPFVPPSDPPVVTEADPLDAAAAHVHPEGSDATPASEPPPDSGGDGATVDMTALSGDLDDLLDLFQPRATDTPLLGPDGGSPAVEAAGLPTEAPAPETEADTPADDATPPEERLPEALASEAPAAEPATEPVSEAPVSEEIESPSAEAPFTEASGTEALPQDDPIPEPPSADARPPDAAPSAETSPAVPAGDETKAERPTLSLVRLGDAEDDEPTVDAEDEPDAVAAPVVEAAAATAARPSVRRPRLHPDDPLASAAHDVLAYHVGQVGWCAADLDRDRGPYRLYLALHRVRLSLEVFAPVLPADAVARLHAGLRRLAVGLGRAIELERDASPEAEVRRARALDAVRTLLEGGTFAAWIGQAERLVDRLAAQRDAGAEALDDAPLPWDDYIGDVEDQPSRSRLGHLLGTALWSRVEAAMVWGRDAASVAREDAYPFALACSGIRFVLGLAERVAPDPVREADARLEQIEAALMHTHRGGSDEAADAWKQFRGDELRSALAEVLRRV
ncbi:MAG: CYTH domain-containing protein [Bacteroidota bacterium]